MNRKVLTAAALVVSTGWFACGGETTPPAESPKPEPVMSASAEPVASASAEPAKSAEPVASASAEPVKPKSLFERIGEKDGVTKIVDEFITIVGADKRLAAVGKVVKDKKKVEAFRSNMIDHLCQTAGGPCEYKGKDMKSEHKGMRIKEGDFAAYVEDLTKALDKNNVGQTEKDEILAKVNEAKADIVEEPKAAPPAKTPPAKTPPSAKTPAAPKK